MLKFQKADPQRLMETLMTEEKSKVGKQMNLAKLGKRLSSWAIAILGSIGVIFLLMMFAGVFTTKVSETSGATTRKLKPGTQVVEVRLVRQPRFESAVGSIEPIHQSSVASKILAKVTKVNVTAGQAVDAGDVLVQLNDDDLQSRLKQSEAALIAAQANAEQSQSNLKRAQQLVQGNAISQSEYESVATAVRTTEANQEQAVRAVEEAKVMLGYATITSPLTGIVVDKQVQEGDTVAPGQTLLTLYDPTHMQLVANVRESFARKLKVGQEVPARLETMDFECMSTVREVVPEAEAGSRSFRVKVSGPCPPGIYSGMFGRIMLPLDDEELVVIPSAAVKRVGQLTLVDVVEGDSLDRRSLQLGRTIENNVEVLSGLKPGERVAMPSSTDKGAQE